LGTLLFRMSRLGCLSLSLAKPDRGYAAWVESLEGSNVFRPRAGILSVVSRIPRRRRARRVPAPISPFNILRKRSTMSISITSRWHSTRELGAPLLASALASSVALAVPGIPPSVIAMNQKLKGDAFSITYAYVPKDGTLAIFSSDGSGKMSAKPVGHIALSAGDHRDVKVTLSSSPKPGTKLWAVLEQSGSSSAPFKDAGQPAEQSFKVL
jgi:hypothetical protein